MAEGYGANFAMVMEQEEVKKIVWNEMQLLEDLLENYDVTIGTLAQSIKHEHPVIDGDNENDQNILQAYETLQAAFKSITGLDIYLSYHSKEDEGDKYDAVDGAYFALDFDQVFQYTSDAKQLLEKVKFDMGFYVTYG